MLPAKAHGTFPTRSIVMNLLSLIKKPLIAAVLGAATIAVPVGALYVAGATRAVASPAPATPAPAANPATMLPDFSTMVLKYGPAVVNISVVSKMSASLSSQGDDNSDGNDSPSDNNPFGPFFHGQPFQMPQPQPMRGEGSG